MPRNCFSYVRMFEVVRLADVTKFFSPLQTASVTARAPSAPWPCATRWTVSARASLTWAGPTAGGEEVARAATAMAEKPPGGGASTVWTASTGWRTATPSDASELLITESCEALTSCRFCSYTRPIGAILLD